jgi:effector-binding domain-containing protein
LPKPSRTAGSRSSPSSVREEAIVTHDFKIKEIEPVDVVGITLTASPESVGEDSTTAYRQITEALDREAIPPSGPPRLVYLAMGEDAWTLEACVPVPEGSGTPEGLTRRRFEGGRAASTVHVGPYEELGMAYRELEAWVEGQGLTTSGPPFDVYLNDPAEVGEPARFETEVLWPVT